MNQPLVDALFQTHALRICPDDQPFWYTSGKLGPFYINTHFLYGSEAEAVQLLSAIENAAAGDRNQFARVIGEQVMAQYAHNPIYRGVVDALAERARGLSFDLISGGERRDFFFSLPVARLLGVPHLSIFKDLSTVYSPVDSASGVPGEGAGLGGQTALHIADLVTEASSYLRAWIPALQGVGLCLRDTLVVIDRDQDGAGVLAGQGVRLHALLKVDGGLLDAALQGGQLTPAQRELVAGFLAQPEAFTPAFLQAHPDFLPNQIAQGGKGAERARLCIEKGFDRPSQG